MVDTQTATRRGNGSGDILLRGLDITRRWVVSSPSTRSRSTSRAAPCTP